jgi:hypothetical protein
MAFFLIVYLFSLLVCWGSLALNLAIGGKYVSILSWNLFTLEELYRYQFGGPTRTITGLASIVSSAFVAIAYAWALWVIRWEKGRLTCIIIAIVLGLATIMWFPNPWENM